MNSPQNVILSIDEGTSGTRAAVVGQDGQVHCLEYHPLRVVSPRHGVVEQDANEILTMTLAVCRKTIAEAQSRNMHIQALAIATQRSTAVLWDRQSGQALVPAMVWQDARYARTLADKAGEWDRPLLNHTGRPVGIRSPYLWAARHIADTPAIAAAHRAGRLMFGTIDSWLLWHLTEERRCLSTPTNATSAGAYQLRDHRYYAPWLAELAFPSGLLPTLVDDGEMLGTSRKSVLGIAVPVLACMGDQFAGAVGLGCIARGQSLCMHGTGSFVDLLVGDRLPTLHEAGESTLVMTARRLHGKAHYSVETFVPTSGSALNWVCENLGWFDTPEQISDLAAQTASAGGVSFIPALTGLRVPVLQPQARASLNGISISTTRAQIARAILASGGLSAHLGERYGAEAHFVSDLIHANPALETPIIAGLPYTEAEVIYAIRHELAGSVDDILSRRLRARLMARDASATAADRVGELLQQELNLAPAVVAQQIAAYRAAVKHEKSILMGSAE
ncbi:FGGY family carbohydrate kinase [Raoultella ornithinolytica]